MRVYTKLVLDMETGRVLEAEGYEYSGPVAECKGPSADQKALAASQKSFFDSLSSSYKIMFGENVNILKSLESSLAPILKAGPNQFGFSPKEETALRTQASDTTAKEFAGAQRSERQTLETRGGGNTLLPSGAEAQIEAGTAQAAAGQESAEQLGITEKGYEVGRNEYWAANDALSKTAQEFNPTGFAGAANQGGAYAGDTFNKIAEEEQAASPWAAVSGALGGALGTLAGTAFGGGPKGAGGAGDSSAQWAGTAGG